MKNVTFLFFLLLSTINFAQTTALYDFTFTSIWNETDHTEIPNDAHWSNLVGATHKTVNAFFELGQTATLGIKNIAELGNNTAFNNEVNSAINNSEADQWLQEGFSPRAAISSATISDIEVTEAFHLITLVSMVAPSPDWFIAINSLDLRNPENTSWKTSFSVDVFVYDAGTDDGPTYMSPNNANSPVGIFKINGLPINGNKIGTLTVTLKAILGVNNSSLIENIRVYPNPTRGEISISNIQDIDLKTVQVYNVLGKLIKTIVPKIGVAKMNINLSELNKGIYLIKLETREGAYKTQKITIN